MRRGLKSSEDGEADELVEEWSAKSDEEAGSDGRTSMASNQRWTLSRTVVVVRKRDGGMVWEEKVSEKGGDRRWSWM